MASHSEPLSWDELAMAATWDPDFANGPNTSFSRLRLFGETAADVRVTFYRDTHSWCPYCQKVWIFLEENKIPYRVEKVNMNFYGEKQAWFLEKFPEGKVPAVEIHGKPGQKFPWMSASDVDQKLTDSDQIIAALEKAFKPLPTGSIEDMVALRNLERQLFNAWATWLCCASSGSYTNEGGSGEEAAFRKKIGQVAAVLEATPGDYFLDDFSVADIVFAPFLERMLASLFLYKGYNMKEEQPAIDRWFKAMERRTSYLGTQADFATHHSVLPPSMGGCYDEQCSKQVAHMQAFRQHNFRFLPEVGHAEPPTAIAEALTRTLRCKDAMISRMHIEQKYLVPDVDALDKALRCAMTAMITGENMTPPPGTDAALRWIKTRTCCPRDMSVWAARRYRTSLEATATLAGTGQPKPIPTDNRYDQDPIHFSIMRWDLSQGFRGPKDFNSKGSKDVKRSDSHNGSEASTGSGSSHTVRSRASKLSDTSTASGWDEPVLKQKIGAGQPISAPKPKGKKSFFQNLFTPPWRSCACNES